MSTYLQYHHGNFWFQIKVPKSLIGRYSDVVRQNLQTSDRAVAQFQAYQMAGQWLSRFQAEKSTSYGVPSTPDLIHIPETLQGPFHAAIWSQCKNGRISAKE